MTLSCSSHAACRVFGLIHDILAGHFTHVVTELNMYDNSVYFVIEVAENRVR